MQQQTLIHLAQSLPVTLDPAVAYDALLSMEPGYPFARTDSPIPAEIEGHDASWPLYHHDVAKARTLLEEASYGDGFSALLAVNEGVPLRRRIAGLVAKSLHALQIDVRVEALPWADFLDGLKRGTLSLFGWNWVPDYPDPHSYLHPLYHSMSLENFAHYNNPDMDSLINKASMETEPMARARLYQEAQRIAVRDAPYLFMVQGPDVVAHRDHLTGFVYNPLIQTGDPVYFYPIFKID